MDNASQSIVDSLKEDFLIYMTHLYTPSNTPIYKPIELAFVKLKSLVNI